MQLEYVNLTLKCQGETKETSRKARHSLQQSNRIQTAALTHTEELCPLPKIFLMNDILKLKGTVGNGGKKQANL